mgnify:FL=1
MKLQRLTALVNGRPGWLEVTDPPRTTHYYQTGSLTSLCNLLTIQTYWRGRRRRLKRWQGCGQCRIRLALRDSTPFNTPRQMRLLDV